MKASALGCCAMLLTLACGKTGNNQPARPSNPVAEAGAGGMPPLIEPTACASPQPGPSPMLRLTRAQVENTLRDLFRDAPAVVSALEPILVRLPPEFPYESSASPHQQLVDVYHELAHEAALAVSADADSLAAFVGCDLEQARAAACRVEFVTRLLRLTSRRPPGPDELSEALTMFQTGHDLGGDAASGVRAVVELVLQSPDFLYLIERGEGDAKDGVVALTSHETATRLAYLLTDSMPDAELLAAAEQGSFTDASLEEQARRLLGSPANRRLTRAFMERLLRYGSEAIADSTLNPTYSPDIAALAREESGRFVEDVVFDGAGTFRALFSERSTWLNRPLSQFYGVAGITGEEFQKVDLSNLPRAGILTQSAFLNATSSAGRPNPVLRGVTVLRNVLCVEPPAPPSVPPALPDPDVPEGGTSRQRLEAATSDPVCNNCHRNINPIGFAFENYDGVGLWRELDHGLPIDASGTLYETDAQGNFNGAVELVQRIAESQDAHGCFVQHWMNQAYGREESPDDACAQQAVQAAFRESDGNIVEMLVALAKTDQLRYRLASELEP